MKDYCCVPMEFIYGHQNMNILGFLHANKSYSFKVFQPFLAHRASIIYKNKQQAKFGCWALVFKFYSTLFIFHLLSDD
jgi:hypothetical protein